MPRETGTCCMVLLSLLLAACAQVRGDTGGAANAQAVLINPFCHLLCFANNPRPEPQMRQ